MKNVVLKTVHSRPDVPRRKPPIASLMGPNATKQREYKIQEHHGLGQAQGCIKKWTPMQASDLANQGEHHNRN